MDNNFIEQHKTYIENQYNDLGEVLSHLSEVSPKLAEEYKRRVDERKVHPYTLLKRLLGDIIYAQEQGTISP